MLVYDAPYAGVDIVEQYYTTSTLKWRQYLGTLSLCTESQNNKEATLTVIKPEDVLCVRSALNAVEYCEMLGNLAYEKTLYSYAPQFV